MHKSVLIVCSVLILVSFSFAGEAPATAPATSPATNAASLTPSVQVLSLSVNHQLSSGDSTTERFCLQLSLSVNHQLSSGLTRAMQGCDGHTTEESSSLACR